MKHRLPAYLIFLMLQLACITIHAQAQKFAAQSTPEKMDSLKIVLQNAKTDMERIEAYKQLCLACDIKDNLKYAEPAIALIEKQLPKAKNEKEVTKLLELRFDAVGIITYYYSQAHKDDTSAIISQYKKHLAVSRKYKNTAGVVRAYLALADRYAAWGVPLKRLDYLKQGYATMKTFEDKKAQSRFIIQLAFFYAEFGDTTQAIKYLRDAQELEKKIGDSTRISRGHYITGKFYDDIKRYDSALHHFNEAEKRFTRTADTGQLFDVYYATGNTLLKKGSYDDALKYYEQYLAIANGKGSERDAAAALVAIGDVYSRTKQYDKAVVKHKAIFDYYKSKGFDEAVVFVGTHLAQDYFMMGDYQKARPLAHYVLDLSYRWNNIPDAIEGEKMVYQIDSAAGDYKSAFEHYQKYRAYTNKLNKEAIHKASLQEKFQQEMALRQAVQEKKDAENTAEKRQQKYILYSVSVVLLLVMVLAVFIFRGYRQKQKANRELSEKNETIVMQKHLVEEKQKEIIESISYAKYLQEAILPAQEFIDKHLPKNFVLYKPKDIVAGDFYWAEKIDHLFFVAAADSTGHGVPGAMVSVVCSNALNRSVKEFKLTETGKILDKTRELVLETFAKSSSEVKDGMDISLLCIDLQNKNVTWSGANNPLWYAHDNALKEIRPDKQPIGKTESPRPFTSHKINYIGNTTFYLFTDGYADQFGGPKGKKLKYKTMEEKLLAIHQLPMSEQKLIMDQMIEEWMGDVEQNDDICLIGVRI